MRAVLVDKPGSLGVSLGAAKWDWVARTRES